MILEVMPRPVRYNDLLTITFILALVTTPICASGADVEVWAVPSIHKVRPDDPAQSRNAVWDGASRTISAAAREMNTYLSRSSSLPSRRRIETIPSNPVFSSLLQT